MNMTDLPRAAVLAPRGDRRSNEPMWRHTSWRAGGPAEHTFRPVDLDDLALFLAQAPAREPVWFAGLGSNLLVRDGGVRGTVVFTHGALDTIAVTDDALVYAEAGVASPKVSRFAATHAFEGAEFLAGIPGTVGGALAMNAGCYGAETWDRVEKVLTIDRQGVTRVRMPSDYVIGYRHCELAPAAAGASAEWFVGAWFRFPAGDGDASRGRIREFLARRIATQPLGQPNAGSVFRNPPGDHAARLIQGCGLKGHCVGGAMVSPKHANFIVNTGGATAADIENLIVEVRATVERECGVLLDVEVRIVGDAT